MSKRINISLLLAEKLYRDLLFCLCLLFIQEPILAQIIPDRTLPNNSLVTSSENIFNITGGTTIGNNLFHSFQEFSVPTGNTALFNNDLGIANIFNRITGNAISNIDGLLQGNGSANLFLINPNGIIFGPNASLNIGGSFLASTANSIIFPDNREFSAINPQDKPLLSINLPIGLQYGNSPQNIVVRGQGNNLSIADNGFTTNRDNRPLGMQVTSGQTLALLGGNVVIDGGNLTATEGKIQLAGINSAGIVSIDNWQFNYDNLPEFGNIDLVNAASIEVSGNGGGQIQLIGDNIAIADGSAVMADTMGSLSGGNIIIQAQKSLTITGISPNLFSSRITAETQIDSLANSGGIDIKTGSLLITDGSQVSVGTFGFGRGGNLKIKAVDANIIAGGPFGPSGLFAPVAPFASGNGGSIELELDSLIIIDGAQIAVNTLGAGNAGSLKIRARSLELIGTAFGIFPSSLLANVESGATGNGGNLEIVTEELYLSDGAQILVNTFGSGNAGSLKIIAQQVAMTGISSEGIASALLANVEAGSAGMGGNLILETDSLKLSNGAQIGVFTSGSQKAGTLTIKANKIEAIGSEDPQDFLATGLFVNVNPDATGNGGTSQIKVKNLSLTNGAQIVASTFGSGNAGNIEIVAENIDLIGFNARGRSGIVANAINGTGNGGNINIVTNSLNLFDGATISVSNFSTRNNFPPGEGQAGNIQITAEAIAIDNGFINASTAFKGGGNIELISSKSISIANAGKILAETNFSGDGGKIGIESGFLNLVTDGQISTNSIGLGQAGQIAIAAPQLHLNQGKITATSQQTGGGDITSSNDLLFIDNNSLISTSVLDSTGGGGNLNIDTDFIIARSNSDLRANAILGTGGNIQINTQLIFLFLDSNIDASSSLGIDGTVTIINPNQDKNLLFIQLPENFQDTVKQIRSVCNPYRDNTFVLTGKGGFPVSPVEGIRTQNVWQDLRQINLAPQASDISPTTNSARSKISGEIVEAKSWVIEGKENVKLIDSFVEANANSAIDRTWNCYPKFGLKTPSF
jgi:filamentous hemagglutinin family protein